MFKAGLEDLKDEPFLLLGKVARPFGIKGEIRIHPYNPFSETFPHLRSLFLRQPDGSLVEYIIENVRPHQNFFLVRLQGVNDRDQAASLRDREVLVKKEQLKPAKPGEYYWFQLLGLKVRSEDDRELGQVVAIEQTNPFLGGNDILVVRTEAGDALVPLVKDNLAKVDLEKREIIIRHLEDFKT
jgi:16S rRNA processing protein RimM